VLIVAAGMTLSGTALTGCGLFGGDPEPVPAPDPMQPVLDEARALAARYDRLAVAQPDLAARLTPLSEDHKAHIAELSRLIETSPPSADPSPSVAAATGTIAQLRTAEQKAQRTAATSARTAPGDRAALLGSIAACRATHVEALR
jgi:hypothetical protein